VLIPQGTPPLDPDLPFTCISSWLSMILHSTRTELERYRSVLLFMSFMSELVTMMTSSAEGQMSLMQRYTILRRLVSLLWNSLVAEKNTSDASFCARFYA